MYPELSRLKREVVKNPGLMSGNEFKRIGRKYILKSTRRRLLNKLGKNVKPVTRPPLKPVRKQNSEMGIRLHEDRLLYHPIY